MRAGAAYERVGRSTETGISTDRERLRRFIDSAHLSGCRH
ncbi:Unknown protein sequence [Pseudomonas syringae pv. maculicola]|nr:Unknown protein sequence [Pseudomonas syringae pv. maculicola]